MPETMKHPMEMPSNKQYVNSSAYGFCVFTQERMDEAKKELLECANELEEKQKKEIRGTILIAQEGVNIRLSGDPEAVVVMQKKLRSLHQGLKDMQFKDSFSTRLTLPRMLVKFKKEVISMGCPEVKPAVDGLASHISPEEFKSWLDEDKDMFVLDTR
jgi:UPF0176 protein